MATAQLYKKRVRIEINGNVQGVGFRPTVYRYAKERGLAGWVSNTSEGVIIEAEGDSEKISDFVEKIKSSPPPHARISNLLAFVLPVQDDNQFEILPSIRQSDIKTDVSPDIATCPECLEELADLKNHRFQYPFINCTNCGPRFTIISNVPYDRDKTMMKKFIMCPGCRGEYENPLDRRFHAQPNACKECGPVITLVKNSRKIHSAGAIREAIQILLKGKIVAIKGLGGFHLACDATNDKAVAHLRKRKYRQDKPFALMAPDVDTIKKYCKVSSEEEKLLLSCKRPIVLLKRKNISPNTSNITQISKWVASHNNYLGFMLPYTPLHYLLFSSYLTHHALHTLVMTSGNISDEPIAYKNEEAVLRLSNIADCFLMHDRDIYTSCDDSVAMISPADGNEMVLRRSRGYVPQPIQISNFKFQIPILACGGHLKNTFALAKGDKVFMSHYIGDMENAETFQAFEEGVEHFKKLFDIEPKVIAHDLHPDYLSSKYACKVSSSMAVVSVQHHHAHIVSCMVDNSIHDHKVIGVAFDGAGLGTDINIWGGEFLVADYSGFIRAAHIKYIPLPGGESAIREPWRIAASYLYQIYGEKFLAMDIDFVSRLNRDKWLVLQKMIKENINCPLTSGMGRLFDAVSSLIGLRDVIKYEGQAAVDMEMSIQENQKSKIKNQNYGYNINKEKGIYIIDTDEIVMGIVEDLKHGMPQGVISFKFHATIVEIIVALCQRLNQETGLNEVCLTGGVFQNVFLLNKAYKQLAQKGFRVYMHHRVPANDGGISIGQAVIANSQFSISNS